MLKTALGDLQRLQKIMGVLAKHGFGRLTSQLSSFIRRGRTSSSAELPPSPARRFRMALDELGPTFVKLGQVLSTRPDLLPPAFIEELAKLQDNVEPMEQPMAQASLEAGLRAAQEREGEWDETATVDRHFSHFEWKPLASASIGQVHKATTTEGAEVVVKIQRPGIKEAILKDLDLLYGLAKLITASIEEASFYDPVGIVREFESVIIEELDFTLEARNMMAFHRNFEKADSAVIPRPFMDLTSPTLLVMDFIPGVKINKIDGSVDRKQIAANMIDGAFQMIFDDCLFHSDPHPGNILVTPEGKIGLLDFGQVGRISPTIQENLVLMMLGIVMRDSAGLARLLYKIAVPEHRISLADLRRDITSVLDRYMSLTLDRVDTTSLLAELLDLASQYKVKVPADYAVLAKAAMTIESIVRDLHPDLDILETAMPYARKLMRTRYSPRKLSTHALRLGMNLVSFIQDLPGQMDQILMDLETGKLTLRVENPGLEQLGMHFNSLGMRLFLGLCACGLLVGIFISLASQAISGLPLVLAILALLFIFGFATVSYLGYGKDKRINLRRWLLLRRRVEQHRQAAREQETIKLPAGEEKAGE